MISSPTTFNYLVASDEPTAVTSFFLLQSRLLDFDHRNRTYVPALAESWRVGPDGRTVDLILREGLTFSDGDPLTAEDVVFTLRAIYDERTGAVAFRDSLLISGEPIDAKAFDNRHVQLIFPRRVAAVENYLVNFAILPSHVLKEHLESGNLAKVWKIDSDPRSVVTSGPFVVQSATPGESITLARNPHYWRKDSSGTQLPYLDKLVLRIIEDPNNTLSKLLQNEVDMVDRIRPADYASLVSGTASQKPVDMGPGMATDYLWFNLNKNKTSGESLDDKPKYRWFSDKRFRQAVSHAVDRTTIASTTLRGLATPLYGFVSPASHGWADPNIPKIGFDLEKSRKLLTEAGFTLKESDTARELFDAEGNLIEFSLLLPAGNEPRQLMASIIQQDLARLGIKMSIVPIEIQGLSERWARSFDYDAVLLGLAVTDFEPSSFANFLLSSGPAHQWQPAQKTPATEWEARIDSLFGMQAVEADRMKRAALFSEIQKLISEESPIIPIAARHVVSVAGSRIGNYSPSVVMPNSLWNVDELFIKE